MATVFKTDALAPFGQTAARWQHLPAKYQTIEQSTSAVWPQLHTHTTAFFYTHAKRADIAGNVAILCCAPIEAMR